MSRPRRMSKWLWITGFLLLSWFCVQGQIIEFPKKKPPKPAENIFEMREFRPESKSSTLYAPAITFPNINRLPYYYDQNQRDYINRFYRDGDWATLLPTLAEYVSHFGVENFNKDIQLLELLAQAAQENGRDSLAKECYRLVLKHHRGNGVQARKIYDSLTQSERFDYVELQKYYALLDRIQLVDSLRPPEDMGVARLDFVNSEFEDYAPMLSDSDSILYFTTKRSILDTGRRRGLGPKNTENIYFATRNSYGEWDSPQPLLSINSAYNEGSPAVSRDGTLFVFARCNAPDGFGNCDLYMSYWLENERRWSDPVNMGPGINSDQWDSHPNFSPGGDTLFFSSSRLSGFGGADLYFSFRDAKGYWHPAQNLGPYINTLRNEVSPFMHPIEQTLYFSSDGQLVNFGSFDIFKTHQIGQYWQEPKNVGPFVNTAGSEFYFTIDKSASLLYYARAEHNEKYSDIYQPDGNSDLFSFPLAMGAQPAATVRFSGRFEEPTTGEVFKGIIALFDVEKKVPIEPKYIREDGTFEFELIDDRTYVMIVSGENFFRLEELFHLRGDTKIERTLKSIKTIQFESLEFASGSSEILPTMENDLHLLVSFLDENPGFYLRIMGHTDALGDSLSNIRLSQSRADAIRNYILSYGEFAEDRVVALGFGSAYPLIIPEKTPEDRRINRRVEFRLSPDAGLIHSDRYLPPETITTTTEETETTDFDDGGW